MLESKPEKDWEKVQDSVNVNFSSKYDMTVTIATYWEFVADGVSQICPGKLAVEECDENMRTTESRSESFDFECLQSPHSTLHSRGPPKTAQQLLLMTEF